MSHQIQKIYTDGACSGNPGPGGWGTVVYFSDGAVQELGGGEAQTTNNRMELQAAIAALGFLLEHPQPEPIALYTDSEYVKNGVTKWVKGWKRKGWKTATGKPVLNQDLWETLDALNQQADQAIGLEWRYVRGHSGDVGNDRCDEIARGFAQGRSPQLRQASLHSVASDPVKINSVASNSAEIGNESAQMQKNSSDSAIITLDKVAGALQSSDALVSANPQSLVMVDSTPQPPIEASDLPREVRITQLRNLVETLRMADEVAKQGYLITSSELADLMDVNASAVTSRGDNWVWRNWVVSRVRREGNQILWQLERVD